LAALKAPKATKTRKYLGREKEEKSVQDPDDILSTYVYFIII